MDSPYKRMVVLSETEYAELQNRKRPNSDTVKWPVDTSTEREEKLYALSLRKHREAAKKGDAKPKSDTPNPFQAEIDRFPATFRSRAQRLLSTLVRLHPHIQWNANGEVSFGPHGAPFSGSNITDLIYHASAVKRRSFTPLGWTHFLRFLKDNNVPGSALSVETLKDLHPTNRPKRRKRLSALNEVDEEEGDWINL